MRITSQAKQETRRRILEAAAARFAGQGFDATTTRDVAADAGIAAGTLFNYFATKEDLANALLGGDYQAMLDGAGRRCPPAASLEERLFVLINATLEHLAPHRAWVVPLLADAGEVPTAGGPGSLKAQHLEAATRELIRANSGQLSAITIHLYWTLILGIVSFWSRDTSPGGEDTLALIDQSVRLFVQSLSQPEEQP